MKSLRYPIAFDRAKIVQKTVNKCNHKIGTCVLKALARAGMSVTLPGGANAGVWVCQGGIIERGGS